MINLPLTDKIKAFLDTPHEKRDYAAGADLLGQVSRNRILYANVSRNPQAKADAIVYHLRKIYDTRMKSTTHEQVQAMMVECKRIGNAYGLRFQESKKSELQRGRRADHDSLPPEIQALYVENTDIRRRMRECHTHLRLINSSNSTCPDSDRYPWAKQLIEFDTRYRDNWNRYDHYVPGQPVSEVQLAVDPRTVSKNAAKTANMLLGKYMKSRDPKLETRIREAYSKVLSPTPNLVEKMRKAGLV